jgi:predicted dehydrogenase
MLYAFSQGGSGSNLWRSGRTWAEYQSTNMTRSGHVWPSSVVGVAVIGYGYWGPNLVRNFANIDGARVIAVSDLDTEKLALARRRHPDVTVTNKFHDLLNDSRIDAIAIATPVHTHYDLALAALAARKHVLIEKPLAQTSEQARHLIEEAARHNLLLMVDHTFLYTPAVQKIRDLIGDGVLGDIYYYNSVRASLGLFQPGFAPSQPGPS